MNFLSRLNRSSSNLFSIKGFLPVRVYCRFVDNALCKRFQVTGRVLFFLPFFFIFNNDLIRDLSPSICLFADDCVITHSIHFYSDALSLQDDLNTMHSWCSNWHLFFNIDQYCYILLSRSRGFTHNSRFFSDSLLPP